MIHYPGRDDERNLSGDRDALKGVPFAHLQPVRLETPESPTRIEYIVGSAGLDPDSTVQVRTGASGSSGATVTYALETSRLPETIFKTVNEILLSALENKDGNPHDIAKKLYEATVHSGPKLWNVIAPPSLNSLTDPTETLEAVIPPVNVYLKDPTTIGKRFIARRGTGQLSTTVATELDIERNLVQLRIVRGSANPFQAEQYTIPGRIHPTNYSLIDIQSELRTVALAALEEFRQGGLKVLREYVAVKAREHFTSSQEGEAQTLVFTRRFPCNSTVRAKIRPQRAVITVSSDSDDKETRRSGKTTAYKWFITGDDKSQGVSADTILEDILPRLAELESGAPLASTFSTLNKLARRQGLVARASAEAVLGSDAAQAVRRIPDLRLTRARENTLLRPAQIADSLRGVNLVQLSALPVPGFKDKPHVIRTMEVGVSRQSDGRPAVHILAWNQISNRVQATLSADAVERHGGLKAVMVDLGQALREQATGDYPWQGRTRFLKLLKDLQAHDPSSSWVAELGDGKFPALDDILAHRMIDQVAAPLIVSFGRLSHNSGITDSYVTSSQEKQLHIVLGDTYQRHALSLRVANGNLTKVSVIPRIDVPNGERVLAWNQALEFPVHVTDVQGRGQETVSEIVRRFASFVTSRPDRPTPQLRKSKLLAYLNQISRKG